MRCHKKPDHYVSGIVISVWTLVQTSFHILWVLSGYFFYKCELKPTYYWLVMMYLTYFYNSECGEIVVQNDGIFKYHSGELYSNDTEDITLYEITKEIVKNGELPVEAKSAQRAVNYMVAFLFADAIWIITAVLMLIGSCCQVKRRLAILFHGPWLVMTAVICIMDVVAAVHFGVDLLQITDYTSLFRFIGIINYRNFSHYDNLTSSNYVPIEFTTVLCLLFGRFLIFWVSNIIMFSRIMNTTIWAYAGGIDMSHLQNAARRRQVVDSMLNLDTSESRIRTWQMFYGAIESTSTLTSEATSRRDCNSNEAPKKPAVRIDPIPINIEAASTSHTQEDVFTSYRRFSDISLPGQRIEKVRKNSVDSLKGHFPWSYTECENMAFSNNELASHSPRNDHEQSTQL